MKKKTVSWIFLWLLLLELSFSQHTFAGDRIGNGGGAFVCWSGNNVLKSISYDLWFSSKEYKFSINRHNDTSVKFQYQEAIKKIGEYSSILEKQLKEIADSVYEKVLFDLNDQTIDRVLAVQNDFTPDEIPGFQFCSNGEVAKFQTAILYKDGSHPNVISKDNLSDILSRDNLKLFTRVMNKLETNTDFAALIVHEALYKWMRLHERFLNKGRDLQYDPWLSVDANEVFKYVGLAFSDLTLEPMLEILSKGTIFSKVFHDQVFKFRKNIFDEFLLANSITEMEWVLDQTTKFMGKEYGFDPAKEFIYTSDMVYTRSGNYSIGLTLSIFGYAAYKLSPPHVKFLLETKLVDPKIKYQIEKWEEHIRDDNGETALRSIYVADWELQKIIKKISHLRNIQMTPEKKVARNQILELL